MRLASSVGGRRRRRGIRASPPGGAPLTAGSASAALLISGARSISAERSEIDARQFVGEIATAIIALSLITTSALGLEFILRIGVAELGGRCQAKSFGLGLDYSVSVKVVMSG